MFAGSQSLLVGNLTKGLAFPRYPRDDRMLLPRYGLGGLTWPAWDWCESSQSVAWRVWTLPSPEDCHRSLQLERPSMRASLPAQPLLPEWNASSRSPCAPVAWGS